jgi:cyanophycinase
MGDYIFAAFGTSVTSREALSNPYSNNVTLVRSFLSLPFMRRVITDSHFKRRDRMGRLLTFMARIIQDGWDTSPLGIGIDEGAALGIDDAGTASVFADEESVYFLNATAAPSVCASRQPLSFANIHLQKLNKGDLFDLTSWTKTSGLDYTVSVLKGRIESSQGSIY